jgi:L-threonylcarbamoyladenylate synthase
MADVGKNINQAMQLLRAGELVGIPTETVYGLAANALNKEAVVKIFEAKNRPSFDPLIVHVNRVSAFSAYAREVPDAALQLAEVVCPGPVTFILKKKQVIPDLVTSGHQTVGLRVPNHPLALDLLNRLEFPLAAPSANPFGYTSPTNAWHVQEQMGEKIPYILDGGECAVGLESTIIDFSQKKPRVLRLGGLALELIEEMLGEHVAVQTSSSNPQAPGMLSSHYNPGKPVLVGEVDRLIGDLVDKRVGLLVFKTMHPGIDPSLQQILSPTGNLAEAARNFFGMLRSFNAIDVDVVLAEWLPDEGLGRAMNDRLKRAAARQN